MESPSGFDPYEVLTGLVVPRPIAWVSTLSPEGIPNLAPFSFYNAVCDEPPVVLLSISRKEDGSRKDTARNILSTGEFVINFLSEEFLTAVQITSEEFPPHVSEFERAGLKPVQSYRVKVPRVEGVRAWLECRLFRHEELFNYDLIFGKVALAAAESLDSSQLRPLGRLSGKFCRIIEINQSP